MGRSSINKFVTTSTGIVLLLLTSASCSEKNTKHRTIRRSIDKFEKTVKSEPSHGDVESRWIGLKARNATKVAALGYIPWSLSAVEYLKDIKGGELGKGDGEIIINLLWFGEEVNFDGDEGGEPRLKINNIHISPKKMSRKEFHGATIMILYFDIPEFDKVLEKDQAERKFQVVVRQRGDWTVFLDGLGRRYSLQEIRERALEREDEVFNFSAGLGKYEMDLK